MSYKNLLLFLLVINISSCEKPITPNAHPDDLFLKGNWQLTWQDEFNGPINALPSKRWFFFYGWNGDNQWRDAYNTQKDAYLDGDGHLIIRARVENDTLKTSYLRTFDRSFPKNEWSTFGLNNGKYFEANIKLSELKSGGLWAAFWLYATENNYDGNPQTGTEIDIMENVISYGNKDSWTSQLPEKNSLNYINVATHWGSDKSQNAGKFINVGDFGINIHDGEFHRFGLRWYDDKLSFYIDENLVYTITQGVPSSNNEAIVLSIEYDAPPGDAWGINENILDYSDSLPDYFIIDYVRVYDLMK